MRYLKTYEEIITLDLDDSDKMTLLTNGLNNGKVKLVKDILSSGIDPNTLSQTHNLPILLDEITKDKPNLEMIQMIIDSSADVNFMVNGNTPIICCSIYYIKSATHKGKLLEIIRKMLRAGADLFVVSKSFPYNDFFGYLEIQKNRNYITQAFIDKLMKIIKEESPEQYDKYHIMIAAKKYNVF